MATITQDFRDVTGVPNNARWTFSTTLRVAPDGAVITPTRKSVRAVDGVLTVELEPGPAVAEHAGRSYPFTVPEVDSELWPLIQAAVDIPADTPDQKLAAAVADYLTNNPATLDGGTP